MSALIKVSALLVIIPASTERGIAGMITSAPSLIVFQCFFNLHVPPVDFPSRLEQRYRRSRKKRLPGLTARITQGGRTAFSFQNWRFFCVRRTHCSLLGWWCAGGLVPAGFLGYRSVNPHFIALFAFCERGRSISREGAHYGTTRQHEAEKQVRQGGILQ